MLREQFHHRGPPGVFGSGEQPGRLVEHHIGPLFPGNNLPRPPRSRRGLIFLLRRGGRRARPPSPGPDAPAPAPLCGTSGPYWPKAYPIAPYHTSTSVSPRHVRSAADDASPTAQAVMRRLRASVRLLRCVSSSAAPPRLLLLLVVLFRLFYHRPSEKNIQITTTVFRKGALRCVYLHRQGPSRAPRGRGGSGRRGLRRTGGGRRITKRPRGGSLHCGQPKGNQDRRRSVAYLESYGWDRSPGGGLRGGTGSSPEAFDETYGQYLELRPLRAST